MGTRADFYIKQEQEPKLFWLGSIAWDGYPDGISGGVLKATNVGEYKTALVQFFSDREDVTLRKDGWPWPWDDSNTTDYSYILMGDKVMASCFGSGLFDPLLPQPDEDEQYGESVEWPDMKDIKNVRWDKGSGIIILGA